MNNQKKTAPAAQPVAAPKRPGKLMPRTAPKQAVPAVSSVVEAASVPAPEVESPQVAAPAAAAPATAAAMAKARTARKPSKEDDVVARHQKVLAEALVMAQAINYEQPGGMRQVIAKGKKDAKPEKPAKVKKPKLVRDSYAMPEAEYARIGELKKRLAALGTEAKKSELLRAGIALLAALSDTELGAAMGRVERIKTGRPAR